MRQEPGQPVAGYRRRRRRRELDLSGLPHHRHEVDPPPEEKFCRGCKREKDRIGENITKILEYVPSVLEVHQYVRGKYACRYCKDGVSCSASAGTADRPGHRGPRLDQSNHRQQVRRPSAAVPLGRHLCAARRPPLTKHLVRLGGGRCRSAQAALRSATPAGASMPRDVDGRHAGDGARGRKRGKLQGTILDVRRRRASVFGLRFQPQPQSGRSAEVPGSLSWLSARRCLCGLRRDLSGVGQCQIVEVACWAHARRKFFDARRNYPRQAHQVLEWIRQLYDIEDRGRCLSVEARYEMRRQEAEPVLDKLEAYLAELKPRLLPKSALAKAVTYARNQWDALRRYTADGRLTIDNNTAERTLRHQAIGRKNWLFLGSEQAGPRAAVLYTILAGAKRHRLEPWRYLRESLLRTHADDPQWEEMLPDRWAAQHPEAVLTHRLEESRQKAAVQQERRRRRRVAQSRRR